MVICLSNINKMIIPLLYTKIYFKNLIIKIYANNLFK